jgi:NAD(P)-dependent dehydrogenase (short-subunit alcohol dehydrogenase family)
MNLQLENKLALVTGSTKGIGLAIATGLAREGTRVIVTGRAEKSVGEAAAKIAQATKAAKVETFAGDLSDARVAESLVRRFPAVDILVNNLGIFEPKPFEMRISRVRLASLVSSSRRRIFLRGAASGTFSRTWVFSVGGGL